MKKIKIIVLALVITIAPFFQFYICYDLFVPDDFGVEYEQSWQSDNELITIVTNNKKGLAGHYINYPGMLTLSSGKEIKFHLSFCVLCEATVNSGNKTLFTGDYYYDPYLSVMRVYDIEVRKEYKDEITFTEFTLHRN